DHHGPKHPIPHALLPSLAEMREAGASNVIALTTEDPAEFIKIEGVRALCLSDPETLAQRAPLGGSRPRYSTMCKPSSISTMVDAASLKMSSPAADPYSQANSVPPNLHAASKMSLTGCLNLLTERLNRPVSLVEK